MWKLTIEDDEGATRELDLVRDGYTIGREGTCDVFLPERNVSRRHARLERDADGRWWVSDLGAPYGSFLNGCRIAGRVEVSPGDVLQVGDYWLGLVNDAPEDERAPDDGAARRPSMPWDVRAEPDRLIVFGGPDDGSRLRLDAGPVLIGVGEGVTIRLPEGSAPEGVHALIRPLPQGQFEIVRRSETIALRVRLQLAERAPLFDGDLVHFELSDATEVMAMRFLSASKVRHSTLTPFAEPGSGTSFGRGHRLDPATLPELDVIKAALHDLPLWWRLEGESLWPRPDDYRAEPPRFTDVTSEPPPPAPDVTGAATPSELPVDKAAPPERPVRRAPRWAVTAAALALIGGAWALGRAVSDPTNGGNASRLTAAASGAPVAAAPLAINTAAAAEAGGAAQGSGGNATAPPNEPRVETPPTPPRQGPLASRSPHAEAPARRSEPFDSGGSSSDSRERLRRLCRTYADAIARGDTSPETARIHKARCP